MKKTIDYFVRIVRNVQRMECVAHMPFTAASLSRPSGRPLFLSHIIRPHTHYNNLNARQRSDTTSRARATYVTVRVLQC